MLCWPVFHYTVAEKGENARVETSEGFLSPRTRYPVPVSISHAEKEIYDYKLEFLQDACRRRKFFPRILNS